MSGYWAYIVHFLYPVPLVVLFLFSIPLPQSIRKTVRQIILNVTDTILFFKIPGCGSITLYILSTFISGCLFAFMCMESFKAWEKENYQRGKGMPVDFERIRCSRWRTERNFWISLLSLMLWIILYRVRALMHEVISISEDNRRR